MAGSSWGEIAGISSKGLLAIELRDLSLGFRAIAVAPDNAVAVLSGTSFGGTSGGGEASLCSEGPA